MMDTSGTLKFDPIEVNTELAQIYLEDNNSEFHPIIDDFKIKSDIYVTDNYGNKFFSGSVDDEDNIAIKSKKYQLPNTIVLRKLSKLVMENAELFAQLEYMMRKIPLDDTTNNIWLIAQNLLCHKFTKNNERFYQGSYKLSMIADTHLLCLGCVAQLLSEKPNLLIEATQETAVICHLFTKLCREVGLTQVNFVFKENIPKPLSIRYPLSADVDMECMTGCTGVITEKADIDSAVDIFLTTTTTTPWRIRRILVQECIYEGFKKAVEWKCGLKNTILTPQSLALQKLCTDLFTYNEKVILLDYAGPDDSAASDPRHIFVEAYRTTKEVISLIKSYNVHYLSLWSNNISEANEIAFGIDVPIVWINDFATFRGPPKVSQAIYPRIYRGAGYLVSPNVYDNMVRARESWLCRALDERREIMLSTIENYLSKLNGSVNEDISSLLSLQNALINWDSDQIVDVSKDNMCVCIDLPIGVVFLPQTMDYVPYIRSVVSGNALIYDSLTYDDEHVKALTSLLVEAGVPITKHKYTNEPNSELIRDRKYVTRVVWTNFETIFAN